MTMANSGSRELSLSYCDVNLADPRQRWLMSYYDVNPADRREHWLRSYYDVNLADRRQRWLMSYHDVNHEHPMNIVCAFWRCLRCLAKN